MLIKQFIENADQLPFYAKKHHRYREVSIEDGFKAGNYLLVNVFLNKDHGEEYQAAAFTKMDIVRAISIFRYLAKSLFPKIDSKLPCYLAMDYVVEAMTLIAKAHGARKSKISGEFYIYRQVVDEHIYMWFEDQAVDRHILNLVRSMIRYKVGLAVDDVMRA